MVREHRRQLLQSQGDDGRTHSPPPPQSPPPSQAPLRPSRRHPSCRDYYAILRVEAGAAESEVKAAYRRMALAWHPDRNRGPEHVERAAKAERNFRLVARAHEVLTDPGLRMAFDRGENVDDPKVEERWRSAPWR